MTEPNIEREAVEFIVRYYDEEARYMEVANNVGDVVTAEYAKKCRDTADMLRALLAEAERLRAALSLGIHMREAQVTYFKTRSQDALIAAKALEKEFLDRSRALLTESGR